MVAVNHVTMLALSLASLSFTDAAAVNARPSAPDSPSKQSRQHASPLPMPMKRMVDNDGPSRRQRTSDAMSKRSQKSRTTEVNTPLRKAFMRRQKQASFRVPRSDDTSAGIPGYVAILNGTQEVGRLARNDTQETYTLYASQNQNKTATVNMVSSGDGSCTIQQSIKSTPYCATFNPCPPAPESMKMTRCTKDPGPHSSQSFWYNSSSMEIRPMWGSNCTQSADTAPLNSSTPTVSSRETAKSVTLAFFANKPSAPAANEADQSASASASTSYVATETITTTVTASAGASSSTPASTSSPSVLAAQVDAVSSSTDSVSQTASSSSATDSSVPSASSSVPSASSSVASASSSAVPTPGALAVEAASASASAIPSASSSAVSSSLSDSSASPAPSSVSSVAASTTPSAFAAAADPSVFDSASATSSALGSASVSDAASTSSSPSSSDAASASSSPSSSAADVEPTAPLDEQAVYVGKARGAETPQW